MKTSRKKLINQLEKMEKILHAQQLTVRQQRRYLIDKIIEYRFILLISISPALVWGWKHRSIDFRKIRVKQLTRFIFFIATTFAKRQFLLISRK